MRKLIQESVSRVVYERLKIKSHKISVPSLISPLPHEKNETLDDEIETIPGDPVSPSTFPMNVATIVHFLDARPTFFFTLHVLSHSRRCSTFRLVCLPFFFTASGKYEKKRALDRAVKGNPNANKIAPA